MSNVILAAFRRRFSHNPEINTFTPFGFYEAGWKEALEWHAASHAMPEPEHSPFSHGDDYSSFLTCRECEPARAEAAAMEAQP